MVQREDWEEFAQILREIDRKIPASDNGEGLSPDFDVIYRDLKGFQATAAMLEIQELEDIVLFLENHLRERIAPVTTPESLSSFQLALRTLLEEMEHAANNGNDGLDLEKVRRALEADSTAESGTRKEVDTLPDISNLRRLVADHGGDCFFDGNSGTLQLHFPATPEKIKEFENLFSSNDTNSLLCIDLSHGDDRVEKVINTMREFMQAMSSGDMNRSQEILLYLAEQQDQAGLYNEIGLMARDLHNSLKNFMDTLDPSLREMVESKIPDSGNRLEHILQLTERAANTTLDHVEAMQKRNHDDQLKVAQAYELLESLQAISEHAQAKLAAGIGLTQDLTASMQQTHEDLITVLTAQDYQDLTGQVIMKIMSLLNELELKLVNVIRIFGVKAEQAKGEMKDELYGPAYEGKDEALHSQDDVDALLAQFGF